MNYIVHGFDFEHSTNANAICVHNLTRNTERKIDIFTTCKSSSKINCKIKENVTVHYIPFHDTEGLIKGFREWCPIAKDYILNFLESKVDPRLISISNPIQINQVAYMVNKENSDCVWDIYYLDPYSYNQATKFSKILFPYRFSKEIKHFFNARKIFLTNELFEQYSKSILLRPFKKKFIRTGIPMLQIKENSGLISEPEPQDVGKISLIYSGMFYEKIRNPKNMFDVLIRLYNSNPKLVLYLYGIDEKEITKYFTNNEIPNFIKCMPRVSQEELEIRLNKCNFLINLGNNVTNQLPSKIIDYISTGKPILNFISLSNDTSKVLLEDYENRLNIDVDTTIDRINEFLVSNVDKKLSYSQLNNAYGDQTVDSIRGKINS